MPDPLYTQISPHVWVIHGQDHSRFPSGNAVFINSENKFVLIDTNPGYDRIDRAITEITGKSSEILTDIVLSHTHLDHGRGLADIFERSESMIHALPDTLDRCESKARIGLWAGISKENLDCFKRFGEGLGFRDRSYPTSNKHAIQSKDQLNFGDIKIIAHESFGHCVHMLDYEIFDEDLRCILSCDYDFSPVPWYGVPQRGDSIDLFLTDTSSIIDRDPDYIISSHRIELIPRNQFSIEFAKFKAIIDARTENVIQLITENDTTLQSMNSFVYPLEKMVGRYSEDYICCAQNWDWWLILAHLEKAWEQGKVQCSDAGEDQFLSKCLGKGRYLPRNETEKKGLFWAEATLKEQIPWNLPLDSKWSLN